MSTCATAETTSLRRSTIIAVRDVLEASRESRSVDTMIELRGVTKIYADASRPAVENLDLTIDAGEFVCLVGPSGCGKTTTLKMINRLIEPTAGTIVVNGQDVTQVDSNDLRLGIGYVIQRGGLFPHRTVADNIATVPLLLGWDQGRIRQRVAELASIMSLDDDLLQRYPRALSGGQQQRVGVARALAADPPVLLMDEPFGAVDPVVRERLQEELSAIQARLHKTIVFVTHDIGEALRLADRVVIFRQGGGVDQVASPQELLRQPATDDVAAFLGAHRQLQRATLITLAQVIARHRRAATAVDERQIPMDALRMADTVSAALDLLLATQQTHVDVVDGPRVYRLDFADLQASLR